LPDLLDPWRAVDSRSVFAGRLPLSSLPRLRALLLDTAGDVSFRLAFFSDDERRAVIRCDVAATLRLRCERCLDALDHVVETSVTLAPISGMDEERSLPEHYDPLPVSARLIRPRDLIEDELLLALPQIPMHEPDTCASEISEPEDAKSASAKTSPFAALAGLKCERSGPA